jgi:hypothetical protein
MKSIRALALGACVLSLTATAAIAGPACKAPKEQWMNQEAFKKKLQEQGYQIKTFKVSSGQCYEIYGTDKTGKKVEIYFDPVTAAVLEQK